jgi:crotonobetainyl-CoA:carnitine CoA-transferase CaiB-like acyl-CoA transferase
MQNLAALTAALNEVLVTRGTAQWLAAFDAAGVPAGPVHSIGEALDHPQTRARGMEVELEHPQAGRTRALGCPVHFSATPTRIDRPAPLLGEHSRSVLREFGYRDEEIDAFVANRVVASPQDVTP